MQLLSMLKYINTRNLPLNFVAFIEYLDVTVGKVPFIDYLPNLLRLFIPIKYSQYKQQRM